MAATIRSSHGDAEPEPEWLVNQIAHALRNPIFAAMVQAEALKLKTAGDSAIFRSADMVHSQLKRLEGNIDEMLLLGRPAKLNLRSVDLTSVVTGIADAFRKGLHGPKVGVEAVVAEPQVPITTDPEALVIVLERLIRNAAEHTDPPHLVQLELSVPGPEDVVIVVRDRGSGIPEDMRDRIFLPFFPQHAGRPGLGLSVAAKFAHALGGFVEIDTETGEGTEARVVLPVAGPPVAT